MSPIHTKITVQVALFPLIAHTVKHLFENEFQEIEIEGTTLYLDKKKYEDGPVMGYIVQIHDMLPIMENVDASLIHTFGWKDSVYAMVIEVHKGRAKLSFTQKPRGKIRGFPT